jgi:undecaprenyl-diphosphatase
VRSDDHPRLEHAIERAREERKLIGGLLAVTAALWVFAELADEVIEGTTRTIDRMVLLWFRTPDLADPRGPAWFEEMMRDFTGLGGLGVLTLVTLAAIGYALLSRRWRVAATILVAVVGGVVISTLIKNGIDRPRPMLVPHDSHVMSPSFPSGHSMMAATVYFTLAALFMQFRAQRSSRAYALLVAIVVTVLVGISRVYLGVHWPTDVLAGWTVGAAWALLVWIVAEWLQRHGRLLHQV